MARFDVPSASTSPASTGSGSSSLKGQISPPGGFRVSSGTTTPSDFDRKPKSPRGSPRRGFFVPSATTTPSDLVSDRGSKRPRTSTSPPKRGPPPGGSARSSQKVPSGRASDSLKASPKGIRKASSPVIPRGPQVAKKRGRLGQYQGKHPQPTCDEQPGKKPRFSRSGFGSPGLNWNEGAVWWKFEPNLGPGPVLKHVPCREVIDETDELDVDDVEDVRNVLDHLNLLRLVEHDGFGTDDTRKETAWEHCDAGTLNRLILSQKGEGLPESLIWHTVLSLLHAVNYLNTGKQLVDESHESLHDWKPILHNLINPANIFYQHPRQTTGFKDPTHGPCKLGNFTSCVVLDSPDDSRNLVDLWNMDLEGERTGYEAPELSSFHPAPTLRSLPNPDVFSIGAVAVTMMTGGRPLWDLMMAENISVNLKSRRFEDWRKVWPADRHERLAAMCGKQPGCTQLVDALPFTYSRDLKFYVEHMVSPQGVRPSPNAYYMSMMRSFEEVKERARGTELEGEYVGEGEVESDIDSE